MVHIGVHLLLSGVLVLLLATFTLLGIALMGRMGRPVSPLLMPLVRYLASRVDAPLLLPVLLLASTPSRAPPVGVGCSAGARGRQRWRFRCAD